MFKRLGNAEQQIFDVLLEAGQVLPALRYMRAMDTGAVAAVPARRFLEAACAVGDEMLFYNGMLVCTLLDEKIRRQSV